MNFPQHQQHQWRLKEFLQLSVDPSEESSAVPLQLLHFSGLKRLETERSALWFVAGFQGPARNDAHIVSLLQKAVQKLTFEPAADLFLTPVANPTSDSKKPAHTENGINLADDFPTASAASSEIAKSLEARTLIRWLQTAQPRAVVTFSIGQPMIRYQNVPPDIVARLSELSEMGAHPFGQEPEAVDDDGNIVPREVVDRSFGMWATEQNTAWIDFSIDLSKKSFDDLKEADWRPRIGPALKWLVEGHRFNPPKEEPSFALPKVIPAIELPPEFANL